MTKKERDKIDAYFRAILMFVLILVTREFDISDLTWDGTSVLFVSGGISAIYGMTISWGKLRD